MKRVDLFLRAVDAAFGQPVELRLIGSAALMLQTDYLRGTKDADILETGSLAEATKKALLDLAGKGSTLATRHQVYLEIVPSGVPFLPMGARWHRLGEETEFRFLRIEVLDVVDVVVAKLKRFHAADRADIQAMVAGDRVSHHEFVNRFRSAVDRFSGDARAEDLPKIVRNFHTVERDMLAVAETEIELPDWI